MTGLRLTGTGYGSMHMDDTDRLFTRQLRGEAGPTREMMSRLVRSAAALYAAAPWKRELGDHELIAVDPRDGSDRCYCVLMGTLGEVFGMQAYTGSLSYYLYQAVLAGEEPS